ncbi:MAG TPA: DegT/DnrJ/EryC1/StrS family aminotransferase [Anaerolineales bacterium]|nr:DegT/DnrJ/EryC1/StrS family aminotransferase [Anaerolineales bacterium]
MISISKPNISEAEKSAVMEVLDSGMLAMGPRTAQFEAAFAETFNVKHAIAVSSGTTALHIALLANGVGPGDEVITTPFTFAATVNAILYVGATPVFVDIDEETFNMDLAQVEAKITPRTKAILPIHLYGYMCDMDHLQAIAEKHGLKIIEDACQAVGASYKDKFAGSFGTGTFSFYATKNLMSGEGGMITTNDDGVAELCKMFRSHGMKRRYYHEMLGYNFRMTDIQSAIGLVQLKRLPEFNEKRRQNAEYFNSKIESVITPKVKDGYCHVWHQYTIRINHGRDRDAAVEQLTAAGIGTGIYYPIPAHHQAHIRELVGEVSLPVAERMSREVISLPVHPGLSQADLNKIVEEVNKL